jgi:hypothetical protein
VTCWNPPSPLQGTWTQGDCTGGRWAPLGEHSSIACEAIACQVIACWPVDPWTKIVTPVCAPPPEGGGILPPPQFERAFSSGFSNGFS